MPRKLADIFEAIAWLKLHGEKVGALYSKGDKQATNVVEAYNLVHNASGDQMAHVLLVNRINEFLEVHEK